MPAKKMPAYLGFYQPVGMVGQTVFIHICFWQCNDISGLLSTSAVMLNIP